MKTCSIIVLLFLALAWQAMADSTIVWSGVQNVKMGPGSSPDWLPSFATWTLDVNGDGNNDLTYRYEQAFTVQGSAGCTVTVQPQPPFNILDSVPLAAGITVGPASPLAAGPYSMVTWQTIPGVGTIGAGSWAFVDNAYMGVCFTASDGVHYGWIEIASFSDQRAYIQDWAYQSQPGVGIVTGVIPEPTTLRLCLIGGIVLAVAAWRHHRL